MPFISISNVRVEEVRVEDADREFCTIELLESHARIRVRRSRLYENREKLEEKLGLRKVNVRRSPADYFH